MFSEAFAYLADGANWTGGSGLGMQIYEHLKYTAITVCVSVLIAVPIGLAVGHTGRGQIAVVTVVNALRALPTLGLITFLALIMGYGLVPPVLALTLLAVPPLLAGAYSGIANVDRSVVDAARAMGMTESQVLFKAELRNALPLLLGGLRSATLQVVATVSVVAYVNSDGLGELLFVGLSLNQYWMMVVGAVLIAVLALVLDAILATLVWASAPGAVSFGRSPAGRSTA